MPSPSRRSGTNTVPAQWRTRMICTYAMHLNPTWMTSVRSRAARGRCYIPQSAPCSYMKAHNKLCSSRRHHMRNTLGRQPSLNHDACLHTNMAVLHAPTSLLQPGHSIDPSAPCAAAVCGHRSCSRRWPRLSHPHESVVHTRRFHSQHPSCIDTPSAPPATLRETPDTARNASICRDG